MTARLLAIGALAVGVLAAGPPAPPPFTERPLGQQTQISATLQNARPPRLAIPAFVVASGDPELTAAARTVASVLWDDIQFEEEFDLVSREATAAVPAATTIETIPYDRWTELGADAVVFAQVERATGGFSVVLQLIGVSGPDARKASFGEKYTPCTTRSPRLCAHAISNSLHKEIRHLDGVALTKLAFTSDRAGERMAGRPIERAGAAKEIFISDYDGAGQQAITANQSLNLAPVWAPDGRTLAFTSYVSGYPDILLRNIYETTAPSRPAEGSESAQNMLAAWSPDGTKLAFASDRRGGVDLWVVNRDGTGLRQLTFSNKMGVSNSSPTWSPTGTQIAFTSDRTGSNQIYIMSADGTGVDLLTNDPKADRPTWSPAPFDDIAYTSSRAGGGHDVAVVDVATRKVRILTDGVGDNEQPAFASNGRHIVFVTDRFGGKQIAILDRKGAIQRQITKDGANSYPSWSRGAK